jgi:hypothetical protein
MSEKAKMKIESLIVDLLGILNFPEISGLKKAWKTSYDLETLEKYTFHFCLFSFHFSNLSTIIA